MAAARAESVRSLAEGIAGMAAAAEVGTEVAEARIAVVGAGLAAWVAGRCLVLLWSRGRRCRLVRGGAALGRLHSSVVVLW